MINQIVIGTGNSRQVVPLVRDREQRRAAAQIITRYLLPTQAEFDKAARKGARRAAQHRKARFG